MTIMYKSQPGYYLQFTTALSLLKNQHLVKKRINLFAIFTDNKFVKDISILMCYHFTQGN